MVVAAAAGWGHEGAIERGGSWQHNLVAPFPPAIRLGPLPAAGIHNTHAQNRQVDLGAGPIKETDAREPHRDLAP